jgi:predicted SAM-dependent methyltransferase
MHDIVNMKINGRALGSYAKVQRAMGAIQRRRRAQFRRFDGKRHLRLNVGSGLKTVPGFINLDYQWHPGLDICWDVTNGLLFRDNSASAIFSEHCLEHITRDECRCVLKECFRILEPSGVVRIVVPDAEVYIQCYNEWKEKGDVTLPYESSPSSTIGYTPLMALNRVFREHGHKYCYDFYDIKQLLAEQGFRSIARASYLSGRRQDLLIDSADRMPESVYVEAEK